MPTLLVIGSGRLLSPALPQLSSQLDVYATSRQPRNQQGVCGGKTLQLDSLENLSPLLHKPWDHILISLTPRTPFYHQLIARVAEVAENTFITLLSSTSVFSEEQGLVDETTPPKALVERSLRQRHAEELLAQRSNHCLIRLGGLWGPHHLNTQLVHQRKILPESGAINLVSTAVACRAIVEHCLAPRTGVFHFVEQWHPLKRDFYQTLLAGNDPSLLATTQHRAFKIVDNPQTQERFGQLFSGKYLKDVLSKELS